MKLLKILLLFSCFLVCAPFAEAQEAQKDTTEEKSNDVDSKDEKKKSKFKEYSELITDKAITDEGLFTVHKVDDKYYFEIPDDLLEKEILITSRISGFVKGLNFGGAGVRSRPQQVIRWQRKDDNLMIRSVSYNSVATEEDPIYESVRNNNFEPIIMVFDIKAIGKDSTSTVIDIEKLFNTDVPMIGAMSDNQRKNFGIRNLDKSRSFINKMKAYPENVEIKHVLSYTGTSLPDNQVTGTLSVEMSQSFILLPEVPMQPRLWDARVGYFSIRQTDYSLDEQRAGQRRYITRWRLEPKDMAAYRRGEKVEPKKPIVYYIDPATPQKWRPFIKQGIEDWQVAFEEAGFKNAIMAKDPPSKEEDPDWSPEDVRYSVVRYVSTDIQNAMGPHVHDPRTGEIIESDIIWYHNVMNLLRNWYFVQTAAINPEARSVKFKDEIMGRLIRFVAAHEVGHTLGLPHNMGSSSAYPVESLRDPAFTKRMGTAPSIMDYARFNYVAQPGDGDVGLMPNIGPYDKWSIMYGYKLLPQFQNQEAEKLELNKWITERASDPIYRFGRQRGRPTDPTAQTEDIGDNSMKASEYGIANLKRIVPNLIEWTNEEGKDFADLDELYNNVLGQFRRYMGHVTANIGGIYEFNKTYDENSVVYTHVERARQKEAMDFLVKHLFTTPEWMIDKNILQRIEEDGNMERIRSLQEGTLNSLFSGQRLSRIVENAALNGTQAYALPELFNDVKTAIYSEISTGQSISTYRRNLQRTFIDVIGKLMKDENNSYQNTDVQAVARGSLNEIKQMIDGVQNSDDTMTRYHLNDLGKRIENILDPK
jgi:hypothetical protein